MFGCQGKLLRCKHPPQRRGVTYTGLKAQDEQLLLEIITLPGSSDPRNVKFKDFKLMWHGNWKIDPSKEKRENGHNDMLLPETLEDGQVTCGRADVRQC